MCRTAIVGGLVSARRAQRHQPTLNDQLGPSQSWQHDHRLEEARGRYVFLRHSVRAVFPRPAALWSPRVLLSRWIVLVPWLSDRIGCAQVCADEQTKVLHSASSLTFIGQIVPHRIHACRFAPSILPNESSQHKVEKCEYSQTFHTRQSNESSQRPDEPRQKPGDVPVF